MRFLRRKAHPENQPVRIQRARVAVARFAPVIGSGLSPEWDATVAGRPGAEVIYRELARLADPQATARVAELERLLKALGDLLDLFGEEPMGHAYYPYKAAELIELYCRSATGDLPDDAPVPLTEWAERFAGHVDRQLAESGVDLGRPQYFTALEAGTASEERALTGHDDAHFRELLGNARVAGGRYVGALAAALGGRAAE
ncbi:hypothetical protein [Streptomyces sp. NPDC051310]|uniref:hypothetical protein n=1 Tax=Streptomyces sp. NPDC051310 TaxID=3365649 RepID=UPI0037B7EFB9